MHHNVHVLEVHIVKVEAGNLGQPEAAFHHQANDGSIPAAHVGARLEQRQKMGYLFVRKHVDGHVFVSRHFGHLNALMELVGQVPFPLEPANERLQRPSVSVEREFAQVVPP